MSTPTSERMDERPATTETTRRPRWPWAVVAAVSSWPYLALFAANPDQSLDLGAIATWWLATVALGCAVTAVAAQVGARAMTRAAVSWAVVVWAVFSHATLERLVAGLGWSGAAELGWLLVALPVIAVVVAATRWEVVRRFLAIAASLLAVATAGQALLAAVTTPAAASTRATPDGGSFVIRPDVWFIALDGASSTEFLRERTDYDPDEFEAAMAERGVDLQDQASSNYPFTSLSMSSTLEMAYLYEGVDEPSGKPFYPRMGGDNAVVDLIRANGYAYAHNYPGFYGGSRCVGAEDLCLGGDGSLTETELALGSMVPFGDRLTARSRHEDIAVANDPAHVVERIQDADLPRPAFNFIHVLNPHAPLLRGPDCEVREGIPLEFSHWGEGPEYADASRCLHRQLVTAVDRILAEDPDALIVIQSDHGPRLGVDWAGNPDGILFDEDMHFSILSAIHLPDACDDLAIPEDLVPVNTFRLVRACLEDTEPDLLENRRFPIKARRG